MDIYEVSQLMFAGKHAEAVAAFEQIVGDKSNGEAWSRYGQALEGVGRFADALKAHQKAVAKSPGVSTFRMGELRTQLALGDMKGALAVVAELHARDPHRAADLRAWEEFASLAKDPKFLQLTERPQPKAQENPLAAAVKLIEVAGGEFTMGFSEKEEKALRAIKKDKDSVAEFLKSLTHMRPLRKVKVAPFAMAAAPLEPVMKDYLPTAIQELAKKGWRLPSEAEWEYAARAGGVSLFASGDKLPASPGKQKNKWGFQRIGDLPEVCADGWHASYQGAPANSKPWKGKGQVVRGGAGMLFPWQGTGEWLFMLSAERASLDAHEFQVAIRPVRK